MSIRNRDPAGGASRGDLLHAAAAQIDDVKEIAASLPVRHEVVKRDGRNVYHDTIIAAAAEQADGRAGELADDVHLSAGVAADDVHAAAKGAARRRRVTQEE